MRDYADEHAPIIERGEGVFLFDIAGRRYYDGVSSLWCNVHGHRHPVIDQAIRDQLDRIAHTTLLGLGSVPSIELAYELSRRTKMPHVFFADSGAAAVEVALKVAYQYAGRSGTDKKKFLALRNSYHGDTIGAVSVGGIDLFHSLFKPLLFETIFASVEEFEAAFRAHADELAAVIIEPLIQGAAGMILQPKGFIRSVREMTRKSGVLMIADEVATGFGRTGTMFAIEQEDVLPDVLVLGKGITAGYLPLSAALFTDQIFESFLGRHEDLRHFMHGHTYTGNALACAAALGSLRVFDQEKTIAGLAAKIRLIGREFASLGAVAAVRQCGMMIGIDLGGDPADRLGHRVTLEARKRGMIVRPLGNVVVFMPPLSSTETELIEMCGILRDSVRQNSQ